MASVFLGENIATGTPHLCPPSVRSCEDLEKDNEIRTNDARCVNSGDVLTLELYVSSVLPEPLSLANMVLVLTPLDGQGAPQVAGALKASSIF